MSNILIVKATSMGDIIHTFPMIYDIKANVPNCHIDWLVDDSFADIVKANRLIDGVFTIPLRSWYNNKLTLIPNLYRWYNTKSPVSFDYIIDSQGLLRSALLARKFGTNVHGFNFFSTRERFASLLYSNKYKVDKKLLALSRSRMLASLVFNYTVDLTQVNFGCDNLANLYQQSVYKNDNYVVFAHASSRERKQLSTQVWVELGRYLITKESLKVVIPYGNAQQKKIAMEIRDSIGITDKVILPAPILSEIIPLIFNARFVFGVDTGFTHLANAYNRPTIAIYVATDPLLCGVIESPIAKNIGGLNFVPNSQQLINLYHSIVDK
jgi:heptosyltransferase-1